jgi:hypothetical protein
LFLLASATAFASASFGWITLRNDAFTVFTAQHRYIAVAVGAVMLNLAIDVIIRYPQQLRTHLLVAAASSVVLAALAAYDLITGNARTTRIFTAYVARYVMPRLHGPGNSLHDVVGRLFATWQVWISTGPGVYLAFVAAGLGLAATVMAIRTLKPTSTSVAPVILVAALVMLLPACSSARISARIVLPSRTMAAGSTMAGKVIVTNDTGQALHGDGCGFDVALSNDRITSSIGCAGGGSVTIPIGVSSWPVTVSGSYTACGQDPQNASHPPCLKDGHAPPLPPGDYRAELILYPRLVPTPPSIGIRVTP